MTAVIALDLDQTLIFSARSAGPVEGVPTVWVEDYLGEPLSLMTARAYDLLEALGREQHVVPVTTRTPEQFGRVRLPLEPGWAICSNGGVLLHQGIPDAAWSARVASDLGAVAPAAEVYARLEQVAGEPWVKTLRQVEQLFVYLVGIERDQIPAGWVAALADWAGDRGWSVSVQGRKVYVVPLVLSKGAAAARLAERLGGPLLAAGDSLLDRSLLEEAAFAARPAHGELHDLGWTRPDLFVSKRSGAQATEELLTALSAKATAWAGSGAGSSTVARS